MTGLLRAVETYYAPDRPQESQVLKIPRLSQVLTPAVHPSDCQRCDRTFSFESLLRWRECDDAGKPTNLVIRLCTDCAARLIRPHPRKYQKLGANEPWPGCMSICGRCLHRRGTACGHERARHNGGQGVEIAIEPPVPGVFTDGTCACRAGQPALLWPNPATACLQYESISEEQ